jgi:hypothetical protein
MFKEKHNPRLDRVMRNFEKLDDYLQEYVIKQLSLSSLTFFLNVKRKIRLKSNTGSLYQ